MEHIEFQDAVIEKLTRLETHMETLVGNGQPGRVGKLEEKVEDLQKTRWTFGGVITGVSITLSAIVHFLFRH